MINIAKKASVRKRKKNEKSEKKKSGRNEKTVLRKKVCILKCDLVVQFCEKRLIYDIFIHISGKRLETDEERRLRKEKEKGKDRDRKDGKRSETDEERRIRKEKEKKDRDKSEKEG